MATFNGLEHLPRRSAPSTMAKITRLCVFINSSGTVGVLNVVLAVLQMADQFLSTSVVSRLNMPIS